MGNWESGNLENGKWKSGKLETAEAEFLQKQRNGKWKMEKLETASVDFWICETGEIGFYRSGEGRQ